MNMHVHVSVHQQPNNNTLEDTRMPSRENYMYEHALYLQIADMQVRQLDVQLTQAKRERKNEKELT